MEYGWNNALSSGLYLAGVREFEFGVALGINGHYFSVGSLWLRLFKNRTWKYPPTLSAFGQILHLCLSGLEKLSDYYLYDYARHGIAQLTNPETLSRRHLCSHRGCIVCFKLSLLPVYLAGKNPEAALLAI